MVEWKFCHPSPKYFLRLARHHLILVDLFIYPLHFCSSLSPFSLFPFISLSPVSLSPWRPAWSLHFFIQKSLDCFIFIFPICCSLSLCSGARSINKNLNKDNHCRCIFSPVFSPTHAFISCFEWTSPSIPFFFIIYNHTPNPPWPSFFLFKLFFFATRLLPKTTPASHHYTRVFAICTFVFFLYRSVPFAVSVSFNDSRARNCEPVSAVPLSSFLFCFFFLFAFSLFLVQNVAHLELDLFFSLKLISQLI